MNIRHSTLPSAALLTFALALAVASTPVQAADGGHQRGGGDVGNWIAAQGNTALAQLGEELRRNLRKTLRPLLPEAPAVERLRDASNAPAALTQDTAG